MSGQFLGTKKLGRLHRHEERHIGSAHVLAERVHQFLEAALGWHAKLHRRETVEDGAPCFTCDHLFPSGLEVAIGREFDRRDIADHQQTLSLHFRKVPTEAGRYRPKLVRRLFQGEENALLSFTGSRQ